MILSTSAFAKYVGISEQKARQALRRCLEGGSWRGVRLDVRLVASRGGASGVAYQVAAESVPDQLLSTFKQPLRCASDASETKLPAEATSAISTTPNLPAVRPIGLPPLLRSRVCGDHRQASWRLSIIQPILQTTAPRSYERAARIVEGAKATTADWRGRRCILSERTIRNWIDRYEAGGIAGLMRKAPKNAGKKRVHLSRSWDGAMRSLGMDEAAIAALTAQVQKRVQREWASGTPSWPTVQLNTLPAVIVLTREAGIECSDIEMRRLCKVPRRFVEAERKYSIVAVKNKDAARFAADFTPRIRRDRSHLRPGEWLAADVHHLDIFFPTEDGRVVTPKVVAWMDLATNRAWLDFFIMPIGQMIRREHVIKSFVAMCAHPNWGVPSNLYIDNGGEYNWADISTDLSKLKQTVRFYDGEELADTAAGVQRARPYNPQGKVIEGLFARLESSAFSQLPGWIGGNRMLKKTANQGRAPQPFPGDEAALRKALNTALEYHHTMPQVGHLGGISPNDSFSAFVAKGWRATVLDPLEMAVAFSHQTVKPIRAGGTIRLKGQDYRADELQTLVGRTVLVHQPMFGDREMLFVFTEYGEMIAIARPDTRYAFGDPAGAGEQARRAKALDRDVRALKIQVSDVPGGGEQAMADVVALYGEPHQPAIPDGVIRLAPEFRKAAQMAKSSPARQRTETDRKQAKQAEEYEFLRRLAVSGG